ncbi:uncharacterized protein A4U43_C03F26110 [Asparagus officinalis]|uniref:Uncharacterized protein n=1 Tax=Asparagus officinalis TaxID=4686 RepID=A0A5P1FD19_ASPOF|nr:uncharacterized protein A4U43_C03F26110 [Asparagus officinalis]
MVIKISPSMADQVFRFPKALLKARWAETEGLLIYAPLLRSILGLCNIGIDMEKKKKKIEAVRMDGDGYYL